MGGKTYQSAKLEDLGTRMFRVEATCMLVDKMSEDIAKIKDNHLVHIQAALDSHESHLVKQDTDLEWLKKFFFIVATASIGSLLASLINLI